mmetsp:Transcript_35941/g.112402  ORF Transcript_35941/g.112402 Transcript_35941/m.112402 type:complete len:460 (-) Transcript_35941:557-1936(-)
MSSIAADPRVHAQQAFSLAVSAVCPDRLVRDALNVKHGSATQLQVKDVELAVTRGVNLLSFGKASVKMARAAESVLGDQLRSGIVISQPESDATGLRSEVHLGSRGNIPDARAVQAATKALNMARQCGDGDILLVLISGGGSALLPVPVGSISLEDKVSTTKALATAGASINELNTVRKHISAVKGGKLAAAAYPANVVSLILSDVLDDPIDVIASGPTTFDPSTFADALNLIESRGLAALVPQSVIEYLRAGAASGADETLKEGDARLSRSKNFVIGNNRMAAEAALRFLCEKGFEGRIETLCLRGDTAHAAHRIAETARQALAELDHEQENKKGKKMCVIFAGETTIDMKGSGTPRKIGRGGRCSHMALMVAAELQGEGGWTLLSAGTDGQDGPTDAAGAFCDGSTIQRSQALGLSYKEALETFDSYTFFEQEGGLFRTGLTGTNVMDLHILLCCRK